MRNITKNEEPRTTVKTFQQKHMRNEMHHLMHYFNNKGDSTVHMLDVLKPDTEVKCLTSVLPEEIVTNKSKFDDFKSGGQSPWGSSPGGGNGSGRGPTPPDIDEIIRSLQDKINKFMPGGAAKGGKPILFGLIILLVI